MADDIETRLRALRQLEEMVKAAVSGGYVYTRGNPRPFAVLEDGRLAIDYFMIKDIVDALCPDTAADTIRSLREENVYAEGIRELAALKGFSSPSDAIVQAAALREEKVRLQSELQQVRRMIGDIRTLANAGTFADFEGEPWLLRVRNIDLDYNPTGAPK